MTDKSAGVKEVQRDEAGPVAVPEVVSERAQTREEILKEAATLLQGEKDRNVAEGRMEIAAICKRRNLDLIPRITHYGSQTIPEVIVVSR